MFTVIGGGFGLYGYLPALMSTENYVLLPVKYREQLLERMDLRQFESRITWVPSMEEGLRGACSVIIATPPAVQAMWVRRIVSEFHNVTELFLEKPLAENPSSAKQLLNELEAHSKSVAVGFLFLRCPWAEKLARATKFPNSIRIIWRFQAHHFRHQKHTWKRQHELGGGPLRFYGIHLIALLSSLGYCRTNGSSLRKAKGNDASGWEASFTGEALPPCNVEVETASNSTEFRVLVNSDVIVSMSAPFDEGPSQDSSIDRRVPHIVCLLKSKTTKDFHFLRKVNSLWAEAEKSISPS